MNSMLLNPIGQVRTCFKTKNGTPRQGTISPDSRGILTIDKAVFTNPGHSLEGLNNYSYVWILFHFHLNKNKGIKAKVQPPRLDGGKLGVFATRSPHRPNPIGLTLAKLEKIDGASITVSGLDIVDGTPILDIKPYIPQYDMPLVKSNEIESSRNSQVVCDKLSQEEDTCDSRLNASFWGPELLPDLNVVFTSRAEKDLAGISQANSSPGAADSSLELLTDSRALRQAITDVFKADPRSTYRRNKCSDRLYYFTLDKCHITAWFDYSTEPVTVEVLRMKPQEVMEKM